MLLDVRCPRRDKHEPIGEKVRVSARGLLYSGYNIKDWETHMKNLLILTASQRKIAVLSLLSFLALC
jgi:hypothetical protein